MLQERFNSVTGPCDMSAVRDNSVLQDVSLSLRKFKLILRKHSRDLVLFKYVDIYAFFSRSSCGMCVE
jgi:hypothetical protein